MRVKEQRAGRVTQGTPASHFIILCIYGCTASYNVRCLHYMSEEVDKKGWCLVTATSVFIGQYHRKQTQAVLKCATTTRLGKSQQKTQGTKINMGQHGAAPKTGNKTEGGTARETWGRPFVCILLVVVF